MIIRTNAIVLSRINYSDSDLIVRLFSEEKGMISLLLKGVKKAKSNKTALIQPLNILEIVFNFNDKRDLHFAKELNVSQPLKNIHFDIQKTSLSFFISELVYKSIGQLEPDFDLYNFIEKSIILLDKTELSVANFHLGFMVKLASYLGFGFSNYFDDADRPGIDIEGMKINLSTQEILRNIYESELSELHTIAINRDERSILLEELLNYYYFHLEGMPRLKSMDVLVSLFAN